MPSSHPRFKKVASLRRQADKLLAERRSAEAAQAQDASYICKLEQRLASFDARLVARRRPVGRGGGAGEPEAEAIERERARSRLLAENLLDANEAAQAAQATAAAAVAAEAAARAQAQAAAERCARLEAERGTRPSPSSAGGPSEGVVRDLQAELGRSREAQGRLERELAAVRDAAAQLANGKALLQSTLVDQMQAMRQQLESASAQNAQLESAMLRMQGSRDVSARASSASYADA